MVAPLTDVAHIGDDAERTGAASAIPVKSSVTVVDMPLQEIIDGGHAINVHLSADEIDTYIACGDIGGVVTTDEGEEENELDHRAWASSTIPGTPVSPGSAPKATRPG